MVCNVSKVGEDRQWLRIAEVPSTFLIGTGHASRFAVSNLPIGCEGADVIGSNIRFMTSVVSLFFLNYIKRGTFAVLPCTAATRIKGWEKLMSVDSPCCSALDAEVQ